MSTRPRDYALCTAALEEAVALVRADPDARTNLSLAELLDELATAYGNIGRFTEAVRTMRAAVDAGLGGVPDSRCRIAELLLWAGRPDEAEPIWAKVRADTPGDVWLYNDAGLAYAAIADHATALAWFTDGLVATLERGDPEGLLPQLVELRRESLAALDQEPDDLQARGVEFDATHRRGSRYRTVPGSTPAASPGSRSPVWSWFPASEYERALTLWPQLTAPDGLAAGGCPHHEYCRSLQFTLAEAARSGQHVIRIAAIRVDSLLAFCSERGLDLSQGGDEYVAALAHNQPEQLIHWPPRHNEACWCGSTTRYRNCCGHMGDLTL